MIRKKSSFLTFCFSLLPGAGQMYMGFMKRGVSLMGIFFLLVFASTWLNIGPLMAIAPIIWFYAFFDTHNLRAMPDDEFYTMEDNYIAIPEFFKEKAGELQDKYRSALAAILIIIGVCSLWNNVYDLIEGSVPRFIANAFYKFGRFIPQLLVSALIIALGVYLIRGKKKDLDNIEKDKFLEDKGGLS